MTAPYRYPPTPVPPHPPRPYAQAPYAQAPYAQAPYAQAPHTQAPHAQGPYQPGPYQPGPYPRPYAPGPVPPYGRPTARPWHREPWGIAVLVVVSITLLAGIVLAAGSGSGSGSGTGRRTGGASTGGGTSTGGTSTGTGGGTATGPVGESNCPGGSLEGCYSEGQMQEFLGQAVKFVQGFSGDRYSRMPDASGYLLVGAGRTAQSPCGALDDMAYAYCPGDDRIYIGQTQLWNFYSGIGDAAAVVGLAHEYGHHIQTVAGVPNDRTPSGQVTHENQADCIAGAFVGWAKEKGYLEDSDAQDISGLVSAIASSEGDPNRDHGTLSERAAAMSTGIRDGLPGCSSFYPDTPVHQG